MNKRILSVLLSFVMVASIGIVPQQSSEAASRKVTSVTITKPTTDVLVLKAKKKYKLSSKVVVTPNKAANRTLVYKTSKKSIVTVSSKGVMTAKKKGTAKITVTSKFNKKKKDTITVKVGTPVTKLTMNKTTAKVKVGNTVALTAAVKPTKATYKKVVYVSSNTKVATVSTKGVVTLVDSGKATITARSLDGSNKKATCVVTGYYEWDTAVNAKDVYAKDFYLGMAAEPTDLIFGETSKIIKKHFNSLTPSNAFKSLGFVDGEKTDENFEKGIQKIEFNKETADKILGYCKKNNIKVRFHTFVWHYQTPDYIFYEGPDSNKLVSKEIMLERLKSYIDGIIDYCEQNYPGVIYAYDVANECVRDGSITATDYMRKDSNKWYDVFGSNEYVVKAFEYADAALKRNNNTTTKLIYNDYSTYNTQKREGITNLVKAINHDEKICDGVGMQSHISTDMGIENFGNAIDYYTKQGLEVQITELDIGMTYEQVDRYENGTAAESRAALVEQGVYFRDFMKMLQTKDDVTSVTIWGLFDESGWRNGVYPTLFGPNMSFIKPAFFGLLQYQNIK